MPGEADSGAVSRQDYRRRDPQVVTRLGLLQRLAEGDLQLSGVGQARSLARAVSSLAGETDPAAARVNAAASRSLITI